MPPWGVGCGDRSGSCNARASNPGGSLCPQLVPGRLLLQESRLHAERESTASPLNIPTMAAAVWALEWEQGDTDLAFLELGDPQGRGSRLRAQQPQPGRKERGKDGQQEDAECPRTPQMTAPGTRVNGERDVTVIPGRRTIGCQDKRSQWSRTKVHEKVGVLDYCSVCRWGQLQLPRVWGDEEGDLRPPEALPRAPQTGWGLPKQGRAISALNPGLTRTECVWCGTEPIVYNQEKRQERGQAGAEPRLTALAPRP